MRASEPFRLRPRRPSALPSRRSLPLFQGALRLPSTALQSPPPPHLPDRLQGHAPLASLVPRPMALEDSKPGSRIRGVVKAGDISRIHRPAFETSSTIGLPSTPAPAAVLNRPTSPARRVGKGVKTYTKRQCGSRRTASLIVESPYMYTMSPRLPLRGPARVWPCL